MFYKVEFSFTLYVSQVKAINYHLLNSTSKMFKHNIHSTHILHTMYIFISIFIFYTGKLHMYCPHFIYIYQYYTCISYKCPSHMLQIRFHSPYKQPAFKCLSTKVVFIYNIELSSWNNHTCLFETNNEHTIDFRF